MRRELGGVDEQGEDGEGVLGERAADYELAELAKCSSKDQGYAIDG